MFTGIVSEIGEVLSQKKLGDNLNLSVSRPSNWDDLKEGDSIAVNGTCLTITELSDQAMNFTLIPETLAKTTFEGAKLKRVNLERAMRASDRLDGHFVLAHIDETGKVLTASGTNDDVKLGIAFSKDNQRLVIDKGSITINGVALTITKAEDAKLEVALIPYTLLHTTLSDLKPGDLVNLEFDALGKYVINALKQEGK